MADMIRECPICGCNVVVDEITDIDTVKPIFRCMNCGLVASFDLTDVVGNKVFPVHKDAHYASWNKRAHEQTESSWSTDEILPCPFCGYKNMLYVDWFTDSHGFKSKAVVCPNCTSRGPKIYQNHNSEEELNRRAILSWNTGTRQ